MSYWRISTCKLPLKHKQKLGYKKKILFFHPKHQYKIMDMLFTLHYYTVFYNSKILMGIKLSMRLE